MTFKLRISAWLLIATTVAGAAGAQGLGRAVVAGTVSDDTGAPIPGVTVTVQRSGAGSDSLLAVSEGDGTFRIPELRPGSYELQAMLDGFQPVSTRLTLLTGQSLNVALKLVPAFGETLEVVGSAVTAGEVAVLENRRQSAVVSDVISAEEIRRTPDSTAASVVERLTGVTLIGDKYVFVRGLGERYSGTTINGAILPTTEAEKRVVPLDLFPAKLLETVNVVKTYTPDKPGDFGSGIVEMTTTEFPGGATFKLTLGTSYQSSATGEPFSRYAGGISRSGSGGQRLSSAIPDQPLRRQSILDPSGLTPAELEQIGESFVGDWSGSAPKSASPATDFALTYGSTFGRLGVVLSAVSNHGYEVVDEELRFFGLDSGGLVPRNDYVMTTDREKANAGFVGNLSLRLTDRNRIYLNSVLTRDAAAENRFQEGLNTNSGGFIRDYRVRYQLEEVQSNRLRGEHNLGGPAMGSVFDWSVSYSQASNASDLRENVYREATPGVFALQTGTGDSAKIEFFDLQDEIQQAGASYVMFFARPDGGWSGSLKGGIDHSERTRDFGARRFRFTTANQLQFDLTRRPEEIFTAENIRPNGFEIREVTGLNDAYDAEHTVNAAFLMADTTFGRWRLIGGGRYEDSDQRVTTFDPFNPGSQVPSVNLSADFLPSLNVVYQYAPRSNLRFAYGRSLNRPEFRELSPFTFVEVTGGRSVAGNPDLVQATLDGFDLRWEMFPGFGEVVAASVFYKNIDNPIERIVQPTTELRTSFVNADSATLWGLELEFRRSLSILSPSLQRWSVNLNYTYIDSEVTVGEQQLSVVTNVVRPLEGQSDQVANVALQYLNPERGSMVRLLGSFSGERLTDVGAFGLPDIYESPSTSLDVVISQSLGSWFRGMELKLAGSNLLDEAREFTQGDRIQRRFEPGRKVSLSLSYSPF
jgi:hypothetical protein